MIIILFDILFEQFDVQNDWKIVFVCSLPFRRVNNSFIVLSMDYLIE